MTEPSAPIGPVTFAASLCVYGGSLNMFAKKSGGGPALLVKEVGGGACRGPRERDDAPPA